jgi:protein-S-isoprenylcysteine O-methyltransferase Ste14
MTTQAKAYRNVVLAWVCFPALFFVTSGTLDWWEAWVVSALYVVPGTVFVLRMAGSNPEILERRLQMKEKERTQKRVIGFGLPLIVGIFVIPGLDRRFGWSELPIAVEIAAQAIVLAGYLVALNVFTVNKWASRTVEAVPGQQVISTGPYAVVRHPMYVALIAFYGATPIALGSWWAVIPAVLFVPLLIVRIRNEEEVLVRGLPGYDEYRKKVRFRLIPYVW